MGIKVKVESEVEIPNGLLIYDIGREVLRCEVCHQTYTLQIIDNSNIKEASAIAKFMNDFVNAHAACIKKHNEKEYRRRVREEESQPCRQDYRNAAGVYPLECGKANNHSGPCGPG